MNTEPNIKRRTSQRSAGDEDIYVKLGNRKANIAGSLTEKVLKQI